MFRKLFEYIGSVRKSSEPEVYGKWKETTVVEVPKEEGVCLDAKITRILDGDTVEVSVTIPMRIRLLGVDVAEKNTELGKKAIQFVSSFLNKDCKIYVPLNTKNLLDATQLGRVLGQIWIDGKNLSSLVQEFKK
jgi:endonuclease YncB( thermonuclease family)